jgi:ribosomal protein S6
MHAPEDRVILDISFRNFDYAINACLERCNSMEATQRLTSEILRVMKIRERKENTYRNKTRAMSQARKARW